MIFFGSIRLPWTAFRDPRETQWKNPPRWRRFPTIMTGKLLTLFATLGTLHAIFRVWQAHAARSLVRVRSDRR